MERSRFPLFQSLKGKNKCSYSSLASSYKEYSLGEKRMGKEEYEVVLKRIESGLGLWLA
jgi:hypothetical protein